MAEELKDTNNRIYEDAPDELNDAKYIVTVGDICTIKINEQLRMPNPVSYTHLTLPTNREV